MEELENKGKGHDDFDAHENEPGGDKLEIFSKTIRAGKRTYFFDVKSTRAGEYYLTITESKRRFSNDQGKFFYEKHKLFLYKEDFEKFLEGLNDTIDFIQSGKQAVVSEMLTDNPADPHTDINFEDLESDSREVTETKSTGEDTES